MQWNPADLEVIDIGGSRLDVNFDDQLPKAFAHQAPFPKEIAYTAGMEKWFAISDTSYQTSDELEIIEATAKSVVSQLPSGTKIIDLGAANSTKYEAYAREFMNQGKLCVYVPLDINRDSLAHQLSTAKAKFPQMRCIGLWGNFQHGDAYFSKITSSRLFLSMGSIFYNAPDDMCEDRCREFRGHLSGADCLIVGQDGPSEKDIGLTLSSYKTKEYEAFFNRYLEDIHAHAGIVADPQQVWSVSSKMDAAMHYFEVVAKQKLLCNKFGGFVVTPGTIYTMFPSWKRGEAEIHRITTKQGLQIVTLGRAKNSGMRQYLVKPN
ncbi:Ergothioneine biosynthesis protein 1 [Paramyrothecium foliicola]|nr:Ergothioneine biosynthesis protein 1 [Paramyrothecium foliicola]